jgi:cob(I)alamin adenosyltransferase
MTWLVLGEGFTWVTQDKERDIAMARKGWVCVREMLRDPSYGLVILDEITYPLRYGYLDLTEVMADIAARPAHQHVVLTGRGAPSVLVETADTVTEMADVKHAFRAGIKAQAGIDL